MDKSTFDMIDNFYRIENNIYDKLLEKGMDSGEVENLLEELVTYREQLLRIGKYLVKNECLDKETFIKEKYENIERYIKLYVIYEYDNGMALCETTSGSFFLVPQQLLACYDETDETLKDVVFVEGSETEHVVTYWTKDGDSEHVIYCNSKVEAEQKVKGIDTEKFDDIEIMTRDKYDEFELELIEE